MHSLRPFAVPLTIISAMSSALGCARPSPQPAPLASSSLTSLEAAPLIESKELGGRADAARDAVAVPDRSQADCAETTVGPLSRVRASVTAFLCEGRPRCSLHELIPLASAPGAMEAIGSVWIAEKDVDDASPSGDFVSVVQEHWLLHAPPQGHLTRHLLATATSFLGDESTTGSARIEGDRLHYRHQHAAVSGRWYARSEAVIGLHPLALVDESLATGDHFSFCAHGDTTWSWKSFLGSERFLHSFSDHPAPLFDPAGEHPVTEGQDACKKYEYDLIPDVRLDEVFARGGWKSTTLDRCALDVDGSKGHGYLTFGKSLGHHDASFRVLLSGRLLFVQVRDDAFTGPTSNWVNDDHLEIWLGPETDNWSMADGEESEKDHRERFPAYQWGVRVADAHVFPAAGRPTTTLKAERLQIDANTVRFRIELPEPFKSITVAYSDSDDGRAQKSLLTTSRLTFDDGSTLGRSWPIDPSLATCSVVSGSLEPVLAPPPGPRCALFSGD